jgi:RNA methyltransferase, TrmH family
VITSPHNPKLKDLRRIARRRDGRFVAEGEDLLAAAARAGWPARATFVAAGSGLDGDEVDPAVLARVSTLRSGTRAIGVFDERWTLPAGPLCVALWGVGDPGNVGTVLRSALAFGAGSVALGPGSADPYGHKAVRASMGAIFSVPVVRVRGVDELPGRRVALAAGEGRPLAELQERDVTLVVGAEREGLPDAVLAECDEVCHIPIASESLNAAMAATVAMYEVSR